MTESLSDEVVLSLTPEPEPLRIHDPYRKATYVRRVPGPGCRAMIDGIEIEPGVPVPPRQCGKTTLKGKFKHFCLQHARQIKVQKQHRAAANAANPTKRVEKSILDSRTGAPLSGRQRRKAKQLAKRKMKTMGLGLST